ncbi:hypothetical protein Tco_1227989 [Tanacetum coccineum]
MHTMRGDGVTGIKRPRRDVSSDGVRNFATASGRGRLKEDLESSTWTIEIYTKKRNRLAQSRLNDMVFDKYNRALERRYKRADTTDPILLDDIDERLLEHPSPLTVLEHRHRQVLHMFKPRKAISKKGKSPDHASTSGSRKRIVPVHEIIDVDMDEDPNDVVFIQGKAESTKKMKSAIGISLVSGSSVESDSKKVMSDTKEKLGDPVKLTP